MTCVLVGTDGSGPATRGVAWAASLTRALDGELIIAGVLEPGLRDGGADEPVTSRAQLDQLLADSWSRPARKEPTRYRTVSIEGDPRVALLEATSAYHADVLVLASGGAGWFPALHLGHVAHAIAHHTTLPLVIVPAGSPTGPPTRLLVGIDGSPGSAAAVTWTAALARSLHSDVLAVHVHTRGVGAEPADAHEQLQGRCREWTASLRDDGLSTHVVVAQGWPASALIRMEAIEEPNLIVLGARGLGGFEGLRLGSTALQILQHTHVPAAIIPQ